MRPFDVVATDPVVEIDLQLCDRAIDLFPERDAVELVEDRLVKALNNSVIRYVIRRRLDVRRFSSEIRRYGEPIRDTGRREHEGAGGPPIGSGLKSPRS